MKKVIVDIVKAFLIAFLLMSLACWFLFYAVSYEDTHQDMIVIFLPDGQTIEGLGTIYYYGNGYTWVTIDGVRYYTGTNNVLVVHTP